MFKASPRGLKNIFKQLAGFVLETHSHKIRYFEGFAFHFWLPGK